MFDMPLASATGRRYPELPGPHAATVPMSFVTVRFSGDFEHNLVRSLCVQDPRNQLVVIDNSWNLSYASLGAALEAGIAQARHELVIVVHEDVLLLPGWQPAFERALAALEQHDPAWAFAGVAGWITPGRMTGHWSDPTHYYDYLGGRPFSEVERFDEQLIAVRKRHRIAFDTLLPSIHNIGRDLVHAATAAGRRSYVVNAPTIHKFADARGNPIQSRSDSPKIEGRRSAPYRADRACSDIYYQRKWGLPMPTPPSARTRPSLQAPLILVAHDTVGAAMLSGLAGEAGFKPMVPSRGEDAWTMGLYKVLLAKYRYPSAGLQTMFVNGLAAAAGDPGPDPDAQSARYHLPGLPLVLDAVEAAFGRSRYVHLVRDPLEICLGEGGQPVRWDNQVDQARLVSAYAARGLDPALAIHAPGPVNCALLLAHEMETVLAWARHMPASRLMDMRFEDVLLDPVAESARLLAWLGAGTGMAEEPSSGLESAGDTRVGEQVPLPADIQDEVQALLAPLRRQLGFIDS